MISFRVSEHEFELLKTQSESEGARSVSDFARLALCGHRGQPGQPTEPDINKLKDEIDQLNTHVRRVTELLERARPVAGQRLMPQVRRKSGGA
jgi:hypothetical protein